jgi:Large extracellular alpha-helical protein
MSNWVCRSLESIALLCCSFSAVVVAAQAPQFQPPIVQEEHASASLSGDQIQIRLPLAAPAETRSAATIWLLNPKGNTSSTATQTIAPGSKIVTALVDRPKDDKGRFIDGVEWYRVAYRIDNPPEASIHGILALGAIATNLFHLSVARPSGYLTPGKPLAVRVFAGNPVTRHAMREVRVTAEVDLDVPGTKAPQKLMKSAIVDRTGEAVFTFPVPDVIGVSAALHLTGVLKGNGGELSTSKLDSELEASSQAYISLEKDKPLYQPGQTVHLRALVFDGRSHAAKVPLTLTINDSDGKKVLAEALTSNRFGIAAYDWKLSPQTETGNYSVEVAPTDATELDGTGRMTIPVQRYDLPEFTVSAKLDRGYYLPGQTPEVKIHSGYLFGKPVTDGVVRLVRDPDQTWDVETGKRKQSSDAGERAVLDRNGDAVFHPDFQAEFTQFKDTSYLRYRDLTFRAYVTDATSGRTEPRKFSVRISHAPIHIYLRELGGNNREGDYLVMTSYADGDPAACKVTLDAITKNSLPTRVATVDTNRYGLGKVHLQYASSSGGSAQLDLRITATDAKGLTAKFDDSVNSYEQASAVWINVEKSLLAPREPIRATVNGPPGKLVDLDVLGGGAVLTHQQVALKGGRASLIIPADERFHGLIALVAYSIREPASERYQTTAHKSVLYPEDRELRLKLTGIKSSYKPGEEVRAAIRVTDPKGVVAAAVGVGVTDKAVDERARTEEDFDERSWGWGAWYEEHREIAGLTLDDLNRTDMTQDVTNDLQLAAEAVLQETYQAEESVDSEDSTDIREEYESSMTDALKPLGSALLSSKPEHLTADLGKIREVALQSKLNQAILLDPWNVAYKSHLETQRDEEVLDFASAGPDKKFGTEDDFEIEVARQSVFARTGERLQAMLQSAVSQSESLPGSVPALFTFAKEHGLDLAAMRDPDGRPFVFQVHIERKWLSITARMLWQGENPDSPQEHRFEVPMWTSSMFNYFAPAAEKLHASLRAWLAVGHAFPVSEQEAREAFTDGGIRFEYLHDPTGQPFTIKTEELLSYTRMEEVHAGEAISASVKPVTLKMRAIEILRAPSDDKSAQPEIVEEFLEPYEQQSGKDLKPQDLESGTFRGDTGAIGGTVTDQTGAVIPGATVSVKSGMNEREMSAKSDAAGRFVLGNLDPGFYSVEVSSPGFMVMSLQGVQVSSASLTTVDVTLHVGTSAQTVTVEASAPVLATTSSAMMANDRNPTAARTFRSPDGSATVMQQDFTPRVRQVFEETAFWEPSLETDSAGRAVLHFTMPDSLTTWKFHAVASTVDGRMKELTTNFLSFQPFFVDLDTPQVLTAGDELTLPVNLRNYTKGNLSLPVVITDQPWMESLTAKRVQAVVPAEGSAPVRFGLRAASSIESGHLRISAANHTAGDAVDKVIRIHPDGEPQTVAANALLHDKDNVLHLDLPDSLISGSLHARLRIYPNLAAHIAQGMDALIEQPHGCAEQTISSSYPSLLLLNLAKESGMRSSFLDRAHKYLQQGYERLLDYYDSSGGLTYWGGSDHQPIAALTAYSLEFLADAAPYVSVRDSTVIAARNWLLTSQQADGSWKGHYGKPEPRATLYIAMQLLRSLPADAPTTERDRTRLAVDHALAWAQTFVPSINDPYSNALRLEIAVLRKQPLDQEKLVQKITSTARHDRSGIHWDVDGSLPFYTWGWISSLETSAVVAQSLLTTSLNEEDRATVNAVIQYLIEKEDASGVWYSGQTTTRVLKALLPFATAQIKAAPSEGPLTIQINGKPLNAEDQGHLHENSQLLDAPQTLDVTTYLKPGTNDVAFSAGTGSMFASAQLSTTFYVPWKAPQNPGTRIGVDYGLDFGVHCASGESTVGKPIVCDVNERRFGSSSYGMLLAEVGLPPGADVDRERLAQLQADGTIGRYELAPDHITFYTWSANPAGTHFSFSFTPRFAISAKAAPSVLYDYYNPEERVVSVPQHFDVLAATP